MHGFTFQVSQISLAQFPHRRQLMGSQPNRFAQQSDQHSGRRLKAPDCQESSPEYPKGYQCSADLGCRKWRRSPDSDDGTRGDSRVLDGMRCENRPDFTSGWYERIACSKQAASEAGDQAREGQHGRIQYTGKTWSFFGAQYLNDD